MKILRGAEALTSLTRSFGEQPVSPAMLELGNREDGMRFSLLHCLHSSAWIGQTATTNIRTPQWDLRSRTHNLASHRNRQ